jgi:hypothetical protein
MCALILKGRSLFSEFDSCFALINKIFPLRLLRLAKAK